MLRCRAVTAILLVCGAVLATDLAGCSGVGDVFEDKNEGGWFTKPFTALHKPDWSLPTSRNQTVSLGPSGPVALEQLVGADGRCAEAVAEAAPPTPTPAPAAAPEPTPVAAAAPPAPPADRPVGSIAGDLAGPPMPPAPAALPPPPAPAKPVAIASANADDLHGLQPGGQTLTGGVALGMTECETVRRVGQPNDVNIGAGAKGQRKVVLTYLGGTRPGIYTFTAGRLEQIARAPGQPAPEKPTRKRAKKPAPNKTATQPKGEFVYVQ